MSVATISHAWKSGQLTSEEALEALDQLEITMRTSAWSAKEFFAIVDLQAEIEDFLDIQSFAPVEEPYVQTIPL